MTNNYWERMNQHEVLGKLDTDHPDFLNGKTILDCGCGPGRHPWTFLTMGASVVAFDMFNNALADARKASAEYADKVTFHKHDILKPIDFVGQVDIVWCFGVIHVTIDPLAALSNIAKHVKPGGLIYFLVYPEPRRDSLEDYKYRHQINVISQALKDIPFDEKAEIFNNFGGKKQALGWFDAASSVINELYTFTELKDILLYLGFEEIRRTQTEYSAQHIIAKKKFTDQTSQG